MTNNQHDRRRNPDRGDGLIALYALTIALALLVGAVMAVWGVLWAVFG